MKVPETTDQDKSGPRPCLHVSNQCRLEQGGAPLLAAIRSELTIDNPRYVAARRYGRWVGKNMPPTLTFYEQEGETLLFPRGFANQAVRLCRRICGCDPRIIDLRQGREPVEFGFTGQLRPYQQRAVDAVLAHSFGVIEATTGSGKTVMALAVIAARRQPTLILVHSKELLNQWCERIETFLGVEAGQVGAGRFSPGPVTVAIVNTARNRQQELSGRFGQIVVDECHRVPASLFTEVVAHFDCLYQLGLSATAFRREDGMTALIHAYMGDLVHQVDGRELEQVGAVLKPELVQKTTAFSYGYRGEYARLLKALARNGPRNQQIADDIAALVQGGHRGALLVVSDRVAHCAALAELLAERQVEAAVLTGQVGAEQRADIVRQVQAGEVRVLISTVQLIGEGFDCPGLATLILATPIKFEGRLLQVVGRIMRPENGKRARVIDYVDEQIPVLRRSAAGRREVLERG